MRLKSVLITVLGLTTLLSTDLRMGLSPRMTHQPQAAMAASGATLLPNQGLGGARLGMNDAQAVEQLKQSLSLKMTASGKDTQYEGQTVYYYGFGNKRGNSFPVKVYSDAQRKVFIIEINSSDFATPEGIHVGSSEQSLLKTYGSNLKKVKRGGVYTRYSLGGKKGTDFYVKQGVITQILVRDY